MTGLSFLTIGITLVFCLWLSSVLRNLMKNSSYRMNKQPSPYVKALAGIAITILLTLWLGIPALKKWQADKLVNELCDKYGGSKIYEAVKLPADKFDAFGQAILPPDIKYANAHDSYYYDISKNDVRGNSSSMQPRDLVVWRSETKIIRAADKKVMARLISYTRRGGDAASPFNPSHYSCPSEGFPQNAFIRQ